MTDDKMRAALEAAKYALSVDNGLRASDLESFDIHDELSTRRFAESLIKIDNTAVIQKIDEALESGSAKYPLPQSLVDMTQLQLMEYAARLENQISEMTKLSEEEVEDGVTQVRTESVIRHEQPYEITTDIGVKYGAKGEMQPEASVKIHRKLEDGNEMHELIKVDWSRGVEEVMAAIEDIKKRNAGVR